jgi:hypothetical protein
MKCHARNSVHYLCVNKAGTMGHSPKNEKYSSSWGPAHAVDKNRPTFQIAFLVVKKEDIMGLCAGPPEYVKSEKYT